MGEIVDVERDGPGVVRRLVRAGQPALEVRQVLDYRDLPDNDDAGSGPRVVEAYLLMVAEPGGGEPWEVSVRRYAGSDEWRMKPVDR